MHGLDGADAVDEREKVHLPGLVSGLRPSEGELSLRDVSRDEEIALLERRPGTNECLPHLPADPVFDSPEVVSGGRKSRLRLGDGGVIFRLVRNGDGERHHRADAVACPVVHETSGRHLEVGQVVELRQAKPALLPSNGYLLGRELRTVPEREHDEIIEAHLERGWRGVLR